MPNEIPKDEYSVIGRRTARSDLEQKATGQAKYADDIRIPGLLVARAKRSPYAHAMIKDINISKAEKAEGVVTVLTAKDIPGLPYCGQVFKDMPVICSDKVRNVGDPVAVVVAETQELADAAVELIDVEYEKLPVITCVEEAIAPGAVQIHDSGNIRQVFKIRKGDVDKAFKKCAAVFEDTFETQLAEHVFMETECSVAYYDPDNGYLTVCSPTQDAYSDRRQVAASLALPQNKIRVIQAVTGGAFGGKIDVSTEIIAALATYKTLRPVKYRYDRYESMAVSSKRHPFKTKICIGADNNGRIQALKAEVYIDNGAYASMGAKVVQKGCLHLVGPYKIDNVYVDTYLVYTNRPFGGAMRGFGVPQALFACESAVEMLAAKLGMDSVEFRRINATHAGDTTASGTVLEIANIEEHIDVAVDYYNNHPFISDRKDDPDIAIGSGLSSFIYPIGLGFGTNDTSTVLVRLCDDGSVIVNTGAAELGQGSDSTMARIAAEALGTTVDNVRVHSHDTAFTAFGGMTAASRTTFVVGRATYDASMKVRQYMLEGASQMCEIPQERIDIRNNKVWIDGNDSGKTFFQVASYCYAHALKQSAISRADITMSPVDMETGQGNPFPDYVFGAHIADVEVDRKTGHIDVKRIIAVHDVGKIINPIALEGQIDGALSMGFGQTVMEEVVTKNGHLITPSLAEYTIPTSKDMPEIVFIPLETPSPKGPYGARGVAEAPVVGVAPAICNAIYHATGVRVTKLPITAERMKKLLDEVAGR